MAGLVEIAKFGEVSRLAKMAVDFGYPAVQLPA
jgi:hypothetical protein